MIGKSKHSPKYIRLLDSFKKDDYYYEAYLLINGKVMMIDEKGGIIFFGNGKEYFNYKKKILSKSS